MIVFCLLQVSKAACILTTQILTKILRSKEAAASVNIKTWPIIIDTGTNSSMEPSDKLSTSVWNKLSIESSDTESVLLFMEVCGTVLDEARNCVCGKSSYLLYFLENYKLSLRLKWKYVKILIRTSVLSTEDCCRISCRINCGCFSNQMLCFFLKTQTIFLVSVHQTSTNLRLLM